jgi:voltage-gated potassium channel
MGTHRYEKYFGPDRSSPFKERMFITIFESDTPAGKLFDLVLIIAIALSVLVVMLDSVKAFREVYSTWLHAAEWFFTLLFTVEYALRLYCVDRPARYARSFFGLIDLLAIVPTYFSFFLPATMYVMVIRVLRILRIFRILKLGAYLGEADILMKSLVASRKKIEVFLFGVMMLVIIFGSIMYLVEGEENGFTSIPRSVYWAIVTLTTVGYGDIAPKTAFGQSIAAIIMICGYGIIAVPTGIVSAEMVRAGRRKNQPRSLRRTECQECGLETHEKDAAFCRRCGAKLNVDRGQGSPL